jgi:hypothetical protein
MKYIARSIESLYLDWKQTLMLVKINRNIFRSVLTEKGIDSE